MGRVCCWRKLEVGSWRKLRKLRELKGVEVSIYTRSGVELVCGTLSLDRKWIG